MGLRLVLLRNLTKLSGIHSESKSMDNFKVSYITYISSNPN